MDWYNISIEEDDITPEHAKSVFEPTYIKEEKCFQKNEDQPKNYLFDSGLSRQILIYLFIIFIVLMILIIFLLRR
jgi:hypothetical protein